MRFLKIFATVALIFTLIVCFAACDGNKQTDTQDVYYTVTFNTAGGTEISPVRVLAGSKISEPVTPVREGYLFMGWLCGTSEWNFAQDTVNSDMTLVASWVNAKTQFDYEIRDGVAVILGYKGNESKVTLPRYIDGIEVREIGERAFASLDGESITEIVVGDNITSVGASAFEGSSATVIKLEGKIEEIGERAFFGCAKLYSITLDTDVPYAAFSGCTELKEVVFGEHVEMIGENAFEMCTSLQSIVVHSSLVEVQDSAFAECDALSAIYYYGGESEWESVEIATGNGGNDALIEATLFIYSETEPAGAGLAEYWYIDGNGNKRVW